ncbi:MAG: ion channel, partial [Candidatus Saccharimonadales bacterium]
HWQPTFFDYLYVSITNATTFGPTDASPLTYRAKLLMSAQAFTSLATIALVAARAVSILK